MFNIAKEAEASRMLPLLLFWPPALVKPSISEFCSLTLPRNYNIFSPIKPIKSCFWTCPAV
jgi:hypothetical protein